MRSFFKFSRKTRYERAAEILKPTLTAINDQEKQVTVLNDGEIRHRVTQLKGMGLKKIEQHIPFLFACVREASRRTINMRHFDVQILGGLSLLKQSIAEMKTGEGKTLVATLPLTVHALTGKGAHLITVNEYLADRDARWMGPVYEFLGLSIGIIHAGQSTNEKKAAYGSDITYGTNNEYGFDYLRDNMAQDIHSILQRDLNYALVDEVDSILIDEARTPLIISAPDSESTQLYSQFAQLVPQLKENTHYNIDEKRRAASLTDEGISYIEDRLNVSNLYAEKGLRYVHHLEQALRAYTLYHRDKDYVVQNGQVVIVDEFTGRLMPGRRFSDGLHQALEAKERVPVQQESRTLASITFQNFFRLYSHLAGMTGTAVTSAEEFEKVYDLDVVVIPTHRPMIRKDLPDRIYINEEEKFKSVVRTIREKHERGQPVLVGTIAIEKSELLSQMLVREGIPHEVLNAKHHAREAEIVARAGRKSSVTISTNMAGRGTDIKLDPVVVEVGGLCVLGTERHEARRIDNQLRGRSGRQGDPGESQFMVSLGDDVMRIFGGERIRRIMERLNVPKDEPIENSLVSKALESAQERVEGHYFDMRKQVLAYDDVMNRQRNAIYTLRRTLLARSRWQEPNSDPTPLRDYIVKLVHDQTTQIVSFHTSDSDLHSWNSEEIAESLASLSGLPVSYLHEQIGHVLNSSIQTDPEDAKEELKRVMSDVLIARLAAKETETGEEIMQSLRVAASLRAIDIHWMEHIDTMDYLRIGIGLRGYGQRDPFVEYQKEGHGLFNQLIVEIKRTIVETVFKAQAVQTTPDLTGIAHHESVIEQSSEEHKVSNARMSSSSGGSLHNPYKGIGRNELCPCGSGKKFKKCHGRS